MATDYEVEVEIAIARVRDALLNDPKFIAKLAEQLRTAGFKTSRGNPGANGSSTRNPNSSRVNPPS